MNNKRLIDADYVLSALDTFSDRENGNKHFLLGIETAREIIRDAPTIDPESLQPQWIPVTERLPENGTYLCTMDGELVGQDEPFTGMCGIENGVWDERDCVLAWMPLPEPYCEPTQNGNGECEIEIQQPNRWLETV